MRGAGGNGEQGKEEGDGGSHEEGPGEREPGCVDAAERQDPNPP